MLPKGDSSMNTHKNILLPGLIALGVIVGVALSLLSNGGSTVTGAVFGALLGGLLYMLIQMIVSRMKKDNLPSDSQDEQHPIHHENHQTREAKVRMAQDNVMNEIMHFPPPKP